MRSRGSGSPYRPLTGPNTLITGDRGSVPDTIPQAPVEVLVPGASGTSAVWVLQEVGDGLTSIDVGGVTALLTANTGATSISAFTGFEPGQHWVLFAGDANTTLVHSATLRLAGGVNWTMAANDSLIFAADESGVYEVGRRQLPSLIVQEGDSTVVAAAGTLDFGAGFDVTESPAQEANVALDLSEVVTGDVTFTANAATVTHLRGKTAPTPVAGDDGKVLTYNHAGASYTLTVPSTGSIIVQEGDSTVSTAGTLDFGSGFDVTESPAGEANVALDLSEVVTGDVTFTANAATVTKARGKTIPTPGSGDAGSVLAYDHTNSEFDFVEVAVPIDGFYLDDVAASLYQQIMLRLPAACEPSGWIAPTAGRVIGVWVYSNAARTAGTLSVYPRLNGAGLPLFTATLDGTNPSFDTDTGAGTDVAAGDRISLYVDTDVSWAPTTADIQAGFLWQPWQL